jgi:acyl carrier protein
MENLDRIFAVLKAQGYEITLEEKLKDYLDSLDLVEFVMMIEQEFKIVITNEEIAEIVTVEDVLKVVNSKLNDAN